jgi:hypothetical protein
MNRVGDLRWRTLAEQATRPSCGQVAPPPLDFAPPCLSGQWVQQIHLRNYRSRLLIQINCTIGGASDRVLLVECWPLPLVDDGAGALPSPKDQKQKNARNHTTRNKLSFPTRKWRKFRGVCSLSVQVMSTGETSLSGRCAQRISSNIRLAITRTAITPATESTNASIAS